ncbi:MAG: hypothetical protein GX465_13700 [Acidobacteria bacterium]|nr:hypothetical protein [Acidobacteriota bacterium]
MKKTFGRFVVGLLTLAGLGVWAFAGSISWHAGEIVVAGLALVVVGLAAYL